MTGNLKEIEKLNDISKIPTIIFLDINLSDANGFDFLDQLNLFPSGFIQNIKIILISSSEELKDFKKAKEYGNVYSYILKPVNKPAEFWNSLKQIG